MLKESIKRQREKEQSDKQTGQQLFKPKISKKSVALSQSRVNAAHGREEIGKSLFQESSEIMERRNSKVAERQKQLGTRSSLIHSKS
jgi:hypothetical protein